MADEQAPVQDNAQQIAELAAFAFNEKPADVPRGTQPEGAPPIQGNAPPPPGEEIVDPNVFIKENFGFDSLEAAKAEWATLQNLKNNPPQAEHKFANEESKKWYDYVTGAKEDELYSSLHSRQQLKNLDTMNDEQKLKLYIKMNNPLYDQELVDAVYAKNYNFNETAFKDEDGTIADPLSYRLAKIDALQKTQQDTQKAGEFFSQYKTKIELPPITNTPAADKDYEDYKASIAQSTEAYNSITVPSLKALKETDIPLTFKVDDPNNQMQFDVALALDKTDFDKAVNNSLDYMGYTERSFYDDKGVFQPAKLVRALAIAENFDKYAQSIARQAVNAERKRVIEKETPGLGQRNFSNVEIPDDLKKLEKMVFPGN